VLTTASVVLALTFVAAPFYLRQAEAAFSALDRSWLDASRTLGAGEATTFARVAIPNALPGLIAGLALAWGRALGEFGATLMFAGSFRGVTQTVPLAIYERFATDFTSALGLSAVLCRLRRHPATVKLATVPRRAEGAMLHVEAARCSGAAPRGGARGRSGPLLPRGGRAPRAREELGSCESVAGPRAGPADGRVVSGEDVWLDTERASTAAGGRRCGYVLPGTRPVPRTETRRRTSALRLRDRSRAAATAERGLARGVYGPRRRSPTPRPATLTGGERQRVALARALARRPDVLLLDEPLSALDTRTRASAEQQLAQVLRGADVPTILVTHDFAQAAVIGDEIAVLDAGCIVQRGTASELAARPASAFVADFTGAVVLRGTARPDADGTTVVVLGGGAEIRSTDAASGPVAATVFPWEITVEPTRSTPAPRSAQNRLDAQVLSVTAIGGRVRLGLGGPEPLTAEVSTTAVERLGLKPGSRVSATWKAAATRLVPLG
jgi:molybdopterin-binding protein